MKVDVLSVMDRLIGNTRTMAGLTGDPRLRDHLAEGEQARAAIAELMDAVEWHLRCMDEYPENPVPMNRDGGTTRELRTAIAKVLPP